MFMRLPRGLATSEPVAPTPLLTHVAGTFAPQIAAQWPAPHTPFLTAPAARRHLACLALLAGRELATLGELILSGRLRRALAAALPEAPAGLARALERLGEVAWTAEAYRQLTALLSEPRAAKVLRHAPAISPALVERLASLPAPMASAAALAEGLNPSALTAIREAYEAIAFRSGRAAADAAALRWSRLPTLKALREAVKEDLCPEPPAPPHPGTAKLRPLATKADLRRAGRRYRNCLEGLMPHAASGWSVFYEWTEAPGAVVQATRDHVFGWRLEQARLAGNARVPPELQAKLEAELPKVGIYVGRSGWELDRALIQIEGREFALQPLDFVVAEVFGAD